ncbi:hypothetical protein FB451DRAFT_1212821 [Mycena latifolia]|nr:hypothetical protein FB451DRAFT_1212821 [Mycena latifolia]
MHRCLGIPELVGLICSHLHLTSALDTHYEVKQPTRGNLAAMARTCTALHNPAVDLLWRSAPLMNLLRCFPTDLVEIAKRSARPKYTMRLLRPVKGSDWDRVLIYAPRVKLLFSDPDNFDLSAVFPSISLCLPENMLPNLLSLHWQHREDGFQYIRCFLGPQITTIRISDPSFSALSLLSTLALQCPKLKNITMFLSGAEPTNLVTGSEVESAVSTFVIGLRFIEIISTHRLDEDALGHLHRLPHLRQLRLGALPTVLPVPSIADADTFPSLQMVDLSAGIEDATRFLGWFKGVSLIKFSICVPAFPKADQIHQFCAALAGGVSHSSMVHLDLDNDYDDFDLSASAVYLLRAASIRILGCFVNLTSIAILSPVGIDFDNQTIAELARSWPRIESIVFSSYYSPASLPRLTLQCLESFARYCRCLQYLTLTFDATAVPIFQAGATNCFRQESLEKLDVEHSAILRSFPVARFISRIFPGLKRIQTNRESEDNEDPDELELHGAEIEFHHLWKEVEGLVPQLVEVRAEERAQLTGTVAV